MALDQIVRWQRGQVCGALRRARGLVLARPGSRAAVSVCVWICHTHLLACLCGPQATKIFQGSKHRSQEHRSFSIIYLDRSVESKKESRNERLTPVRVRAVTGTGLLMPVGLVCARTATRRSGPLT